MNRSTLSMLILTALAAITVASPSAALPSATPPASRLIAAPSVHCPGVDAKSSCLVVENDTECPVQVYLDDHSLGVCESFATTTYHVKKTGIVLMSGRAFCDSWGPDETTLSSDAEARWKITETGRNTSDD